MEQYISKSALVEEIERRIKEIDEIGTYLSSKGVLTNLLCHIDTLEVKEVDLERERMEECPYRLVRVIKGSDPVIGTGNEGIVQKEANCG